MPQYIKGNIIYDGVHEPIIDKKTFDAVQVKLTAKNNRGDVPYTQGTYLLHNKITDEMGNIFTNRKSSKNQVRKYRYYNLKSLYLTAGDIVKITKEIVQSFLNSDKKELPVATLIQRSSIR